MDYLVRLFLVLLGVWWIVEHFTAKLYDKLLGHRSTTDEEPESLRYGFPHMEETLEEIRAQAAQEELRRDFDNADDLPLTGVRLWKKGDTITLIVRQYGDPAHPFRTFEYKHDHLDEKTETFLAGGCGEAARIAHGFREFCELNDKEKKHYIVITSLGEKNPVEEPPWNELVPYEFLVGDSDSETRQRETVKCWSLSDNLHRRLERIEKTLEEIRAQPEQEKLRQDFEEAHNLTLNEMRLLKKGDTITLIVSEYGAIRYRRFEYKHDRLYEPTANDEAATATLTESQRRALDRHRRRHHLDEAKAPLPSLAQGFQELNPDQQKEMLKKKNKAAGAPRYNIAPNWMPYEIEVYNSFSYSNKGQVKRL